MICVNLNILSRPVLGIRDEVRPVLGAHFKNSFYFLQKFNSELNNFKYC